MKPTVLCLVFAGALLVAHAGQDQPSSGQPPACTASAGQRRACGDLGITEEQCKSRGCCYQQTEASDVPACFLSDMGLEEACNASARATEECGWQGIDETACRGEGCCYGPLESQGSPKCFRSLRAQALADAEAVGTSAEEVSPKCIMPDAKRVDCGFVGITPEECSAKGCCYYHSVTGHPFCYFKHGEAPAAAVAAARQCEVLDEERIDCGYDGVTKVSCQARGCCYHVAVTPGAPFCFYKRHQAPAGAVNGSASKQCVMPDADRKDCGFGGIKAKACKAKGCCYFHSHTPGSPFCYYKVAVDPDTLSQRSRGKGEKLSKRLAARVCEVPGKDRKDCGFAGISQPECVAQGCCYGHTDVAGAPFCFFRAALGTSADGHDCGKGAAHKCNASAEREAESSAEREAESSAERAGRTSAPSTTEAPEARAHQGLNFLTVSPDLLSVDTLTTTWAPRGGESASFSDARGGHNLPPRGGGGAPLADRIHADVMATNHFRGGGTDTTDMETSNRQSLMTALAAAALVLVVLTGCCLRTQPVSDGIPEESMPLTETTPPSPRGAKTRRLEPGSNLFQEYEKHFMTRWDTTSWPTSAGRAVPPPRISAIYEVDSENRLPAYKAKQRDIESREPAGKITTSPGNEQIEFHGARLKCSYQGMPCLDTKCSVCRIIETGSFACESMGGEIHFRSGSHAAKGQGLAPGKIPPPESLDDFVSNGSGNAVFVANVLLGKPQTVFQRTKDRVPPGMHSRVAEKVYGVDEIVVFDEAQAIPRALILFH